MTNTNGIPITNNIIYNTYRSGIAISGRNNEVRHNLVATIRWSGTAQSLAVAQSNVNYDAAISARNAVSVVMHVCTNAEDLLPTLYV
jgi:parallel beta-helix repeat protein